MERGLQPFSRSAICVPSPQSMSSEEPLQRAIIDVSQRYGSGIMPPVPRRQISSIRNLFFPYR